MKILVIEDEKKAALYIKQGLSEAGYTVDIAEDGEDGLRLATNADYNLIILDVMLPKRDGWSVIKELRHLGKQTLTLMLTARDEVTDRIKGLDLGADAYMVKPFDFEELLALMRSLLRRSSNQQTDLIKVGELEIDLFQHKVYRNKKQIDLTLKEFTLLSILARHTGEIVSRTNLSDQVWGINFANDPGIIDVHVRRLRAKIDDPFEKKLIHTVRGSGYVLREEP